MTEYVKDQDIIRVDYLPQLNYAMWLNGQQCLRRVEVDNLTDNDWSDVTVSLTGEMVVAREEHIDFIPKGSTVSISQLQLVPDADLLRQLTESVATVFKLTVRKGSSVIGERNCELRLLAFDEWAGGQATPELLAAFVTPNSEQLSPILVRAADLLGDLTGSSALDEYQTQDPNRVRAQVACIFAALREQGLVYSAPPASFEKNGQRVRMAKQIIDQKLATCLDLSLLVASCMEACGLHPIVLLLKGHAMVGCWLTNKYYTHTVGDDGSLLLKSAADGINELVLLEATALTSSDSIGFEAAVNMAEKRLMGKPADFMLFVDIFRCRLDGIRPLPLKSDGTLQVDGIQHDDESTLSVAKRSTIDVGTVADETPADRLQIWERKLLDFTMRNSLLNLRLTKKTIPFVSFDLDVLEDHLQAGESYEVLPSPTKVKIQPDENAHYVSILHKEELEKIVVEGLKQNQLYSYLTTEELASVVKTLYRESRTAMEENGADTLFLALGMLKWYETEKSIVPRFAPLVMLPARLVRKSAGSYVLRMREEEATFNTTLVEMLRQQFGLVFSGLSPLPKDDSGVDMRAIFSIVRAHIKEFARWDVVEEAMLGLFSFSKFVMWNDIHSNAVLMRRNHIVDALLQKQFSKGKGTDETIDVREADSTLHPTSLALPVDVDSSQLEAVIESGQQRSYILYGPPGTGKSQTITNIISNALYHGKRVLFVAEKMAALQVVQARMERIGLAPFCLEMHSNKMTKSHLLHQLQSVLELAQSPASRDYAKKGDDLMARRKELIGYVDSLHRKREHGLSLYDCIARYESLEGVEPLNPSEEYLKNVTEQQLETAAQSLRELDAVMRVSGHPCGHPLLGLEINDASERSRQLLATELPAMSQQIEEVLKEADNKRLTLSGLQTHINYINAQESLLSKYTDGILSLTPRQLSGEWQAIEQKWLLPKILGKRAFLKKMRAYKADFDIPELSALCQELEACHQLARDCGWETHRVAGAAYSKACKDLYATIGRLWPQTCSFNMGADPQLALISERCGQWQQHLDRCRDWAQWCLRMPALRNQKLAFAIEEMERTPLSTGSDTADRMLRGCYKRMALDIIDSDQKLSLFNGMLFDEAIEQYRQLTSEFQQLTKKMLYSTLTKRIPHKAEEVAGNTELAQLKRWVASGGRGVTIRRIMEQLPTLLPQLCPCMLMSPISVAQFIDLNQPPFDLVIFDEASQMPTSEAVGAIARGKNLIVVGDPKQMPPTSFFTTTATDDSEADIDDMESILDDCITLSLPEHYLSWHYRSRHESLIAFSNSQYYDGRLLTFPSTDDRTSRVRLVPVEGVYDHGRTRSNRAEAEAIVAETLRRLPEKASIGIVAFSKVQQNLIEDLLTDELAKHPDLERLAYDSEEPVFVKNLENVQGDERDIILFSVGYGPDKSGKVSMNFGPLNNRGGERRLNVAVSRARREMVVFSTLQPEQIDLNRSNARGVEGLKRFLEFAKSGRMAVSPGQIKATPQADSMVSALASELRARGYQVDTKVGRSKFKVDLAVIDPANPGRYSLGILCDGENYYDTKTERDREVVQPGVLGGLQWRLLRVWTIDWMLNRKSVLNRIEKALQA